MLIPFGTEREMLKDTLICWAVICQFASLSAGLNPLTELSDK